MKKLKRSVLRPESIQLNWSTCNDSQRQALKTLVEFLVEAVEELDDQKPGRNDLSQESIHPFYHSALRNRTCLLEGERGSGKTSVLKTLYHISFSEQGRISCFAQSDESETSLQIQQDLEILKKRLIWLDPIDMEVLPGPSNLFAAILTRIEEVIEPRIGRVEFEPIPGVLCQGKISKESLHKLRQLMQDVTLAWDGNMPERGEHLDPDSYAAEVIRAERARVRIPERLREILGSMSIAGKKPLFVLPIDDCDMSPTRCIELLRLLRMLNIPEMFTIVLGKLSQTLDVLQLKLTGDLAKVANMRLGSKAVQNPFHKKHYSLALEVLRKLIPPGQRVPLTDMSIGKSLEYRPTESDVDLQSLMSKIRMQCQNVPPSINDNNSPLPLTNLLFASAKPSELRITSAGILKAPPRLIADLWQSLNALQKNSVAEIFAPADIIGVFVELYRESIRTIYDEELREPFARLFEVHEDENGIRWSISSGAKSRLLTKLEGPQTIRLQATVKEDLSRLQFYNEIQVDGDWILLQSGEHDTAIGPESNQVIQKVMPYATLCNDLIVSSTDRNVNQVSLTEAVKPICTIWTYKDCQATLAWPAPKFTTFVEADAFLERIRLDARKLINDEFEMGAELSKQHELVLIWFGRWFEMLRRDVSSLLRDMIKYNEKVFATNDFSKLLRSRQLALIVPEFIVDSEVLLERLFKNKTIQRFCLTESALIRRERVVELAKMVNSVPNPLLTMILPRSVQQEIAQEFSEKSLGLLKSLQIPSPPASKKKLSPRETLGREAQTLLRASNSAGFPMLSRILQLLEKIRSSDLINDEYESQFFMSEELNTIVLRGNQLAIDEYAGIDHDTIDPKSTSKELREYLAAINSISRLDLVQAGAKRDKLFVQTDP